MDHVGIDGGQSGAVYLTGANANHSLDRLDDNLPIAYLARARGGENRLHAWLDERLGAHDLDLDLLMEEPWFDPRRGATRSAMGAAAFSVLTTVGLVDTWLLYRYCGNRTHAAPTTEAAGAGVYVPAGQ